MKARKMDWRRVRLLLGIPILVAIPLLWLGGCMWQRSGLVSDEMGSDLSLLSADGQLRDYLAARRIEYVSRANWLPSNAPGNPWPGADWRSDPETHFDQIWGVSLHCPSPLIVDCNRVGEIRERERAVVQDVWRHHRFTNGWPDIGYHYLIFPSGRVYEGRAGGVREKDGRLLSIEGAHTIDYNKGGVGIAFVPTGHPRGPRGECDGCFYREMPGEAALRAATHLIAWMFLRNGVDPMGSQTDVKLHYGRAFTIAGHRDFWIKRTANNNLKDCPGDQFYGGKKVGESHPAPENCTTVLCELRRSVAKEMAAATPIPTIAVPNGGEVWAEGTSQTIRWTSTGVTGNVRIDLSRNGGSTWETLFADTANDGSEPWTVTGPATTRARIRVASRANPAVQDISDANFTICTYSLSSISRNFSHEGGSWSFTVTTQANCGWTATTTAPWIRITSGTGTGSGTVRYTVDRNTGTAARTGFITVGDRRHEVNQAAAAQVGALQVTIDPAGARTAGAQWRLTSGPDMGWKTSGATVSNLPVGTYTVTFTEIAGWTRPADATVTIAANQTTTLSRTYTQSGPPTIVSVTPSPSTTTQGGTVTLIYSVNNPGSARQVLLGASIRLPGGPTLSDEPNDRLVTLASGTSTVTRPFVVLATAPSGVYDLLVSLVEDVNNNGRIDSGDRTLHLTTFGGAVRVVKFSVGDRVQVFNTGVAGLQVLDAPCGNRLPPNRFDGDTGVILEGPVFCVGHSRWRIRWSDGRVGWSAEGWLRR